MVRPWRTHFKGMYKAFEAQPLAGMFTVAGAGDPAVKSGMAIHMYGLIVIWCQSVVAMNC